MQLNTQILLKFSYSGIYVHGLYLDGGGWNKQDIHLVESEPKRLFQLLPVLYVTGTLFIKNNAI